MLYILNTRRSLRSADASAGLGNSNTNHPSGSRSRPNWRPGGPVELSSLGGVQVHTQIETADNNYGVSYHVLSQMDGDLTCDCSLDLTRKRHMMLWIEALFVRISCSG